MSSRSVAYTSSPLLASKTPVWRSKFIVAAIAVGFVALAARAAWIQVFANEFFQKQGVGFCKVNPSLAMVKLP